MRINGEGGGHRVLLPHYPIAPAASATTSTFALRKLVVSTIILPHRNTFRHHGSKKKHASFAIIVINEGSSALSQISIRATIRAPPSNERWWWWRRWWWRFGDDPRRKRGRNGVATLIGTAYASSVDRVTSRKTDWREGRTKRAAPRNKHHFYDRLLETVDRPVGRYVQPPR
jgi:hypothetical protein